MLESIAERQEVSIPEELKKQIRVAQLILASSISVCALVGSIWGRWIKAILGASLAILESLQQLGQYNKFWVSYRATAERLKHEKYVLLARSGPYKAHKGEDALSLLAERVEEQDEATGSLPTLRRLAPRCRILTVPIWTRYKGIGDLWA